MTGLRRVAVISASLVGTYALTSVLGLAFWLLAARQFSLSAVGVGGAAVSMMTLLATFGTSGLGTLLISRLPHTAQGNRRVLTRTALTVAGGVALVLAFVVPFVAISVLHVGNLEEIAGGPGRASLFAVGTGLMAVAIVVDQAVLVLGTGSLQLERNAVASAAKLAALAVLALAGQTGGLTIFVAWTAGTLVSLPLVAHRTRGGRALQESRRLVQLGQLRGMGGQALSHHALNVTLQATLQVLPLLVLVLVSSEQNGIFTTALQIAGVVFALPFAITVGLFAAAEGNAEQLLERMRFTIPLSLGLSLLANALILPLAPVLLSFFGSQYADQGANVLRLLALAGLPFVVKDHFVALRRVQGRTSQATVVLLTMTVVEVIAAYGGARLGGTVGLCLGWVAVLFLEAAVLSVPLVRSVRSAPLATTEAPTMAAPTTAAPTTAAPTMAAAATAPTVTPTVTAPTVTPTVTAPTPAGDASDTGLTGMPEQPPRTDGSSVWRRRLSRASLAFGRVARTVGVGPVLLLMTAGLVPMAVATSTARQAGSTGDSQGLWVLGLVMVFLPAAVGVALPKVRSSTPIALALAMAVLLQVSRVVLYPTRFMFHDELIHANVLRQIDETGRLFTENSLLPITAYYPGLEIVTNGVQGLTGLSAHTSAVIVLLLARIVMALAILLLVSHVTRSTRIGAVALVIYACNPQMLFFNSQFSYQTLALPLAIFVAYLVLTRRRGSRFSLLGAVLAVTAVAFTHHVTTVLLVAALAVWAIVEALVRRGRVSSARALALTALAGAVAFGVSLLNPGNSLTSYLGSIAQSSADALDLLVSSGKSRPVFQNAAGVATLPWERVAIVASLVLTLALLVPALVQSKLFLGKKIAVAVLLALLALLYPIIPGGHLTASTAEVGDRSAGFVFLGVGFVIAWWFWQRRARWWRAAALGLTTTVIFLGSVVLGSGSVSQQLPGPFRVSDDARSIDADNLAAASWMSTHLAVDSKIYTDRVGGLLAASVGRQYTVTHIGTNIDASRLLLDPEFGQEDVDLIRQAGIRYLAADRRNAFGLPNQGVYIENGEFGGDARTSAVPSAALRKFSSVPGVSVIYDNGSIVIYDLEALDVAAK
ncbi:MAG: hypothetical protein M3Y26_04695 [Actinomycetota bacterium]|nr:hypothetical protein [Actinomycetota bacterium]